MIALHMRSLGSRPHCGARPKPYVCRSTLPGLTTLNSILMSQSTVEAVPITLSRRAYLGSGNDCLVVNCRRIRQLWVGEEPRLVIKLLQKKVGLATGQVTVAEKANDI